MPQKKSTAIYRSNLVTVSLGQGQIETLPYLYSLTEYNRKGETIAQSSYSSDGILAEKMAWGYNDQGQMVKQSYFTEQDEPSETISYERNDQGQVVKEMKGYLDGTFDTTTYRYDEKGHLLEKTTLDDEGVVDQRETFNWDEKNLLKHEITDEENNLISLDEFSYDENGNVTEHRQVNEETGEDRRVVSKYNKGNQKTGEELFNEEGELIESTTYHSDKSGRVISAEYESPQKCSTIQYFYDEQGNPLGQEEIDEEGNRILWVEHTYDEQNNRLHTTVFANGGTISNSQHYELRYEYEWYED